MSQMQPTIRRLRFDLDLQPDESIPGALARGVADHHLEKLNIVLKEAGLFGKNAGLIQLASPEDIIAIAEVIRCDGRALTSGAGRRLIEPGSRQLAHLVSFGDLAIPRSHLELRRRRISPLTLMKSAYHRTDWLIGMLPFCPFSLERLVDNCSLCETALGWVRTRGVDRCEECGEQVLPNSTDPIPADLAADYRLFASMISLDANTRTRAAAELPPRLSTLPAGDLVRLAVRCGLDCTDGIDDEARAWQTRASQLPAHKIARIVSRGANLLRTWPHGIEEWAADFAERSGSGRAKDLRRRLKRIALGDSGFPAQTALLQEVFPAWAPANSRDQELRRYTHTEVRQRVPNIGTHMVTLRSAGILPHIVLKNGKEAPVYRYCAATVDELSTRAAGSISQTAVEKTLQLPAYAIEQFCCVGLLEREKSDALQLMFKRPQLMRVNLDELQQKQLRMRAGELAVGRSRGPPSTRRCSQVSCPSGLMANWDPDVFSLSMEALMISWAFAFRTRPTPATFLPRTFTRSTLQSC
jgi:hypothetical protein